MSNSRANSQQDAANAELFKRSFREEAREILTELEAALLELNDGGNNLEIVGRIFRGLHTIKGSGAMFGFERMAAFTHDLETAFDRVRNGQLEVSAELIDLTLGALDQIGIMLEEDAGGKAADTEVCASILGRVRRLAGMDESSRPAAKSEAGEAAPVAEGPIGDWRIRFAPGPDLLRFGANPLLLRARAEPARQADGSRIDGGYSRTGRSRSGALLRRLGYDFGHGRRTRCDSRCLHLS